MTNLYAISGAAGSGKDLAAHMLLYMLNVKKPFRNYTWFKLLHGRALTSKWIIRSFADPLKNMLATLLNVPRYYFDDREIKEHYYVDIKTLRVSKNPDMKVLNDNQFNKIIKNKEWDAFLFCSLTLRQLMQWFGTSVMKEAFGSYVWTYATLSIKSNNNLIISDVRFEEEAATIKKHRGKLILIERNNNALSINSNHISEQAWKTMKEKDMYDIIINNDGSKKDLFNKIKKCI